MTTAVIIVTVVMWILICAVFIIASCMLSARIHQASLNPEESNGSRWVRTEGKIPTTPLTR